MSEIRSALDVAMAREVPAPPPPSASPSGRQFDEWELRYGWAGWEILADLYGDRGYDWQQVSVVRSPSGDVMMYADGGCSCNGPFGLGPGDAEPAHWDDVVAAVQEGSAYWDAAEATQFLADAAKVIPRGR